MYGAITTILAVFTLLSVLGGFSETASAQLVREHDAQGLRSFHAAGSRIRRSFQSDGEARAILKQILAVSGLAGMDDRITLRASAETDNAEAFVERAADKEERLIFYNAVFMQEIGRKNKDYWSMVAILAHEVGHHIRLHTVIPGRDHEFELEADYQAGFILRRMGATLEQTQAAFRTVGLDAATASHPARAQRVQAATLGWTDGVSGQSVTVPGPGVVMPPNLQPTKVAVQPPSAETNTSFDGAWTFTRSITAVCGANQSVFPVRIENGVPTGPGGKGSLSPSGDIRLPGASNTFSGKLSGNSGSGTYGGKCTGTFIARRN